jgi:DNA-binding transcriptional ArsR family regulator
MAVRLTLTEEASTRAVFPLSPLAELGHALHVLVQPQHHGPEHAWVVAARERLGREGRRRLAEFAWMVQGFLVDVFVPAYGDRPSQWDEDRAAQNDASLERWVEAVALAFTPETADDPTAHQLRTDEVVRARLRAEAGPEPHRRQAVETLLTTPEVLRQRWLQLLDLVWDRVWREDWRRLEPTLERARDRLTRRWRQVGPRRLLPEWFPLGHFDGPTFVVPARHSHDVTWDDTFFVMPSRFAWPHVRITCDPPARPGLTVPLKVGAKPSGRTEAESAAAVLEALADPGRLLLYRRLMQHGPQTTGELSQVFNLTPSGMSRQLRRLAEGGWVVERRRSYYVFYEAVEVDPERLMSLVTGTGKQSSLPLPAGRH